jgi:hypothetical protein
LASAASQDGWRLAVVRHDVATLDIHDSSSGRHLTRLTPPWNFGVPTSASFGEDNLLLTQWAVHALAREQPGYLAVHQLPRDFDAVLAKAQARLKALTNVWAPGGPAGTQPAMPPAN